MLVAGLAATPAEAIELPEICDHGETFIDELGIHWECQCYPSESENCYWVPIVWGPPMPTKVKVYDNPNLGEVNATAGIEATGTYLWLAGATVPLTREGSQFYDDPGHIYLSTRLQRWTGTTWVEAGFASAHYNASSATALTDTTRIRRAELPTAYYREVTTSYKYNNGWRGGTVASGWLYSVNPTQVSTHSSPPPPPSDAVAHPLAP